jgi:hypothetical protein
MSESEREKFQEHFDGILNLVYTLWKNKYVFVVMGSVWATVGGTILHLGIIPLAKPVVRPIIKNMWAKQVAPYDSMTTNFETRLQNLEQSVFPEAEQ